MMRFIPIGLSCVLACVADVAGAADGLGRLFFAPAQRAQLDTARAQRDRRGPAAAATDTEQPAPQGPDVVTYSGMVRRSDGKSTVWLNGKPVNERSKGKGDSEFSVLGVRRDGAVSVSIPQTDRRASLKVGQSLEVTSGTIEESYARRATLIRPAAPIPVAPPAATPTPSAPVAAAAPAKPAARPVRESDAKEADPASGAAPAVQRGTQK